MDLPTHLAALEAWGLIYPVLAGPQVEYRFRHALVHEAAYRTLLKQDRRELHQAVGEALEAAGPATEENTPLLAYHFNQAGDRRRASRYFTLAGKQAARKFAHREALSYYSQAIEAAAPPPASLFHARGQVYELQGFFDDARQDFERAAEVARAAHDQTAEWQALLSLGLLWAGRDYERSGEYCQKAFDLAQQTGQPRLVAHSYNRLGNWHLNVERPHEAADCHDQALAIFEGLHDDEGVAETLDLLGMSSMIGGDLARAVHHYQQAIALNGRLGNQLALANCLGSQVLAAGGAYQTMILPPGPLAGADLTAQGEQAIRMTHAIGWRDGESFVNMTLGTHSLSYGHHARALRAGQEGLAIASEIGHRQWMAANHYVLGLVYFDILARARAMEALEKGLALSQAIHAQHWVRCHMGMLTVLYVDSQRLDQAEAVQRLDSNVRALPQSIGERLVTYGRAYLAKARGDWPRALEHIERLQAAGQATAPADPMPWVLLLRGTVLDETGQHEQAEADLRAGLAAALAHQEAPLVWRLRLALAGVLAQAGRGDEAAGERARARAVVGGLADALPEAALAENFRRQSGLY